MKIYIAADHRGFSLVGQLYTWLVQQGMQVEQMSPTVIVPTDDYTDYAKEVARKIASEPDARGILICGSGVGMDVTANRVAGVRSGMGVSPEQIRAARADDDINILTIAGDYLDKEMIQEMIQAFLKTPFKTEEKYKRRIEKIDK